MKTKFRIKLDTEFEVDLTNCDFSDNEKTKEEYFKKVILDFYFEKNGLDEVEINVVKEKSLFEVMGEMFKPK